MKKFGQLSKEEKLALFEAWVDGKTIYATHFGEIYTQKYPSWNEEVVYTVMKTPDSIDWSHVNPKYKWMTRDKHGCVYLFEDEPSTHGRGYWKRGGDAVEVQGFASYVKGDVEWYDSLVRRPDNV